MDPGGLSAASETGSNFTCQTVWSRSAVSGPPSATSRRCGSVERVHFALPRVQIHEVFAVGEVERALRRARERTGGRAVQTRIGIRARVERLRQVSSGCGGAARREDCRRRRPRRSDADDDAPKVRTLSPQRLLALRFDLDPVAALQRPSIEPGRRQDRHGLAVRFVECQRHPFGIESRRAGRPRSRPG